MKIKKVLTIVFTVLATAMVVFSGIMKFLGSQDLMTAMTTVGMEKHVILLGLMEITFAFLFVFKPTMKIGFILLSCYFAGAISAEWANGLPFNALIPMGLVWIAAILRDNRIFF